MPNSHKFFKNTDCKYFPCHKDCAEDTFNCLFCYCPLYCMGEQCGGNFKYTGMSKQIKDCSKCSLPHRADYYDQVILRLKRGANQK